MSYFYSHIIEIESIIVKLGEMDFSGEQKLHLACIVDSTIHQSVLDIILSKLSDKDKIIFLQQLKKDPQDKKIMEFLSDKVGGIEDEIIEVVEKLKTDLHQDIEEAKRQ